MKHILIFLATTACFCSLTLAQDQGSIGNDELGVTLGSDNETVSYDAGFFNSYNPVSARDMVEQVPGFQIDTGGELRGFGGTAGNILINGERPSTKNDDASAMLSRIPATQVERIDLIRGETGGLDLRGQTVVVNVILTEQDAASTRWELQARTTENTETVNPDFKISHTDAWGLTRFTIGAEAGEARSHQPRGKEKLIIDDEIMENRYEIENTNATTLSTNLNSESQFLSGAILRLNARFGNEKSNLTESSNRIPVIDSTMATSLFEGRGSDSNTIELGGDLEFSISPSVAAKVIALYNEADTSGDTSILKTNQDLELIRESIADRKTEEEESISRMEFDWNRTNGHRVELNLEHTTNSLENALLLLEDLGSGFNQVPLPGANTRVEETRWDSEINYSFSVGSYSFDGGISYEKSEISQQGDVKNKRQFSYVKPRIIISRAPDQSRQIRVRVQREVAQLDFFDFVSSTNFGDNQFDLGNPELEPENTWVSEVSFERRFGDVGAINITGFHHWISDVQDLLPLGGIFEVPGNIGSGRRWGLSSDVTIPLDAIGIKGGRADISGYMQDSYVDDPVTGQRRVLSNEGEYQLRINFRQSLFGGEIAWGGLVAIESGIPFYGLDEFVSTDGIDDTIDADIFIETTRWFGMRTRLQFGNIFNRTFHRDRQVYAGQRGLTPLAFREIRNRTRGHSVQLSITGIF